MEGQAGRDPRVGAGHLEEMEGAQMSDEARRSEQERRELAVRLEPGLVEALRELASRRGISVSEALREAAVRLVEADDVASRATFSWHVVSVPTVPTSGAISKDASTAR
jgi:predicted nuclease with RNAse H fold